jgi:hypothetical protein
MRRLMIALLSIVSWPAAAIASGAERVDFARDIQPLLAQHCLRCHGGVQRAGGLLLLPAAGMPAAGESGLSPIVPGMPEKSELFRRVISDDADSRMPAESPPLSADDKGKLRRWIEEGASWPLHWSLKRVQRPNQPIGTGTRWSRTPIDAFVARRLETQGLSPAPEADRYTLIRRLSLDLLGLSPSVADADAFAAEQMPDAYERLVDRLLANPHFGERWGRHWLDLARYADSDGYEVDKPRPDAYRWRDWVIDVVNSDMPLDVFTIQQFAGDLLSSADPMARLATAYHRQTLTNNEGGVDKEEYRLKAVLDRVSNTGSVWLGLTLGCAQCHDHPYDPFTQHEYYSLAAIFNNADETEIDLPDSPTGHSKSGRRLKFRALSERDEPRQTRLLKRGEFLQPGGEVPPALPRMANAISNANSPATRMDLAEWLVDPANPLTTRVMTNQTWLKLFGQGLVRTPEDFGARGELPTHPELLDWLASELVARGWSRKSHIRQIVVSATYRQSSARRPELDPVDPLNLLLARQNRFRVEAEIVRDLQLAAGGLLSAKIGGPSVFPPLGEEFVKITFRSELPWKTSTGADRYRRGMYTFFKRSVPYPDLMAFDCPDASVAAAQRSASNTPLQALTTLNSPTSLEAARGLAMRLFSQPSNTDAETIRSAFRICCTRPPGPQQQVRLVKLLHDYRAWYRAHPVEASAIAQDCEQVPSDAADIAALVATANILMNLDEFLTRE